MDLPKLQNIDVKEKKVLVRADLDVGKDVEKGSDRLKNLLPTLSFPSPAPESFIHQLSPCFLPPSQLRSAQI